MCDRNVTVTRDMKRDKAVTSGVTQRVSHATTTTPHHTMLVVTAVGGWSVVQNPSIVKACNARCERRMDAGFASIDGRGR
jgi:hypothetical protein